MPKNMASYSHGIACNYLIENYIRNGEAKYFGLLDHDIFPVEDFLGHLSFNNKCFWEKMCLYQLFLAERERYGIQCKALYPGLYKRYDMLVMHHVLQMFSKLFR